jgi:hypothetical protein
MSWSLLALFPLVERGVGEDAVREIRDRKTGRFGDLIIVPFDDSRKVRSFYIIVESSPVTSFSSREL